MLKDKVNFIFFEKEKMLAFFMIKIKSPTLLLDKGNVYQLCMTTFPLVFDNPIFCDCTASFTKGSGTYL
jgi:hypothetical protein